MANYFRNENFKNFASSKKEIKYKQENFRYKNINYKIKNHIFILIINQ